MDEEVLALAYHFFYCLNPRGIHAARKKDRSPQYPFHTLK